MVVVLSKLLLLLSSQRAMAVFSAVLVQFRNTPTQYTTQYDLKGLQKYFMKYLTKEDVS